ncbi:MAG: UvrD-helicase domain-containing protein [Actinomycetes bacterium]
MSMTLPFPEPEMSEDGVRRLFEIDFTAEQMAAITAPQRPAVVIAGAGSGKTSLMSARVVWLVANGLTTPDAVLGLTFTNKAAAELSTRVRSALRRLESQSGSAGLLDDGEPTISTYHAYAASLLRDYGVWAGYEPSAQLMNDAQRLQLAESVVRSASGPFPALAVQAQTVTERLLALEQEANEHLIDLDELVAYDKALIAEIDAVEAEQGKLTEDPTKARRTSRARLELVGLVRAYRQVKSRRERIDFGDQMAAAATVAERVAEAGKGERDRYSTVLLDEYQDTSMAQQRLMVALFGRGYPVMAVGDPFQSIYGWRGASIRNILSFKDDFVGTQPVPVFSLGQNNRSGESILTAANAIAEPLRAELPEVVPLRPREDLAGSGAVAVGMYRTVTDEVEAVCDMVAHEVAAGTSPREIAVLCRETKTFAPVLAGLAERRVPVDVVDIAGLLEVPEVVEVISVLEVLYDPTANPQLVRLLSGPRWRIGAADLALLGTRARRLAIPSTGDGSAPEADAMTLDKQLQSAVAGSDPAERISLSEALEDPGSLTYSAEARERFAHLARELRQLHPVLDQPPDAAITTVIATLGLDIELAVDGRSRDHLDALLEQARAFAASGDGVTVGPFLSFLRLAQRYDETLDGAAPVGGQGVQLLTVHKAKGLEWSTVFVPGVVTGVFPNGRSRSNPHTNAQALPYQLRGDAGDFPTVSTWLGNQGFKSFKEAVSVRELAEDRRLAYVAFTRAAQRLVVTGHRWGPNQQSPRALSPYLETLLEACQNGLGEVVSWCPAPAEDESNPELEVVREYPWPVTTEAMALARRKRAAELVRAVDQGVTFDDEVLSDAERRAIADWDRDIEALLLENKQRQAPNQVVPDLLSATSAVKVLRDPSSALRSLRRPLPRPPAEAARRGTRFHQWVESRFGQVALLDLDGGEFDDEGDDLLELQEAFLAGPYADRKPLAVEAPFQMLLGNESIAGRIDAIYEVGDDGSLPPGSLFEVVDWKTGSHPADVLQLALYRVAWAELNNISVDQVAATFYYVATGELQRPSELPDRAQLTEQWIAATALRAT